MQGLRMTDVRFADDLQVIAGLRLNMKHPYHTVMRKTNTILGYADTPHIGKTFNNL